MSLTRRLAVALTALVVLAASVPPTLADEDVPRLQLDAQVGGEPTALAVVGSWLYLAIGTRVEVLDISRPSRPSLAGASRPLPNVVTSLVVSDGYAYLADGWGGLRFRRG